MALGGDVTEVEVNNLVEHVGCRMSDVGERELEKEKEERLITFNWQLSLVLFVQLDLDLDPSSQLFLFPFLFQAPQLDSGVILGTCFGVETVSLVSLA